MFLKNLLDSLVVFIGHSKNQWLLAYTESFQHTQKVVFSCPHLEQKDQELTVAYSFILNCLLIKKKELKSQCMIWV